MIHTSMVYFARCISPLIAIWGLLKCKMKKNMNFVLILFDYRNKNYKYFKNKFLFFHMNSTCSDNSNVETKISSMFVFLHKIGNPVDKNTAIWMYIDQFLKSNCTRLNFTTAIKSVIFPSEWCLIRSSPRKSYLARNLGSNVNAH